MSEQHPSFKTLKSIEENLSQLPGEKLLLWGAKDFCFTTHFYERFKTLLPEAKTVLLEEAGHYLLEDAEDKTLKCIKSFLTN
jgi:haloalkane dehalogenase